MEHTILTFDQGSKLSLSLEQADKLIGVMTTVQSPTVARVVIDNTSTPIAGFLCPSRFRAKLKEEE
jgi:hypothetical protein